MMHPDPVVLYADVAARGSLAAALEAASQVVDGFSISATFSASSPLLHASVESKVPHREPLVVSSWAVERRWSIRGEEPFEGAALIRGDTDDLAQVARVARAWQEGAALSDIGRSAPFVHLTGRFEVPDGDPQRLAESEWQSLRKEARERDIWPAYQALVEAAYAEPALRSLYPFTSHWALRFSTTTRPHLTRTGPCLLADVVERGYTVSTGFTGSGLLAHTSTAQEAVAAAVRHLPSGLGPVTYGILRNESWG